MSFDRLYRKTIHAWCMYDWANSAFATIIMAAVFPPFFRSLVLESGRAPNQATAYWGSTAALALFIVALVGPLLGAMADYGGIRKKLTALFAGCGILASAGMSFLGEGSWLAASLLFIAGNLGFAGGNVFYESLLPLISAPNDLDRISTRGYALGYIGGGLLLTVNALWILFPQTFGLPDARFAIRASFFSVAIWWFGFSLPFFLKVPEPPGYPSDSRNLFFAGLSRLGETFREVRRYRQLLLFLAAFWIYNDGIGTIIKMATAYGDEIGIQVHHLIIALLITQFVGVPCSFMFGRLARIFGPKRSILLALGVYALISLGGYFMATAWHFYLLAFLVGTVQGGSQALSRSLFGAMVPKHKASEFFGFYSTSAKFAGILGPFIFGLISQATGHSRLSIAALLVFFVVGGVLLSRVDVEEGKKIASLAERSPRAPSN